MLFWFSLVIFKNQLCIVWIYFYICPLIDRFSCLHGSFWTANKKLWYFKELFNIPEVVTQTLQLYSSLIHKEIAYSIYHLFGKYKLCGNYLFSIVFILTDTISISRWWRANKKKYLFNFHFHIHWQSHSNKSARFLITIVNIKAYGSNDTWIHSNIDRWHDFFSHIQLKQDACVDAFLDKNRNPNAEAII